MDSMGDMGDMGGMDMSSDGMFRPFNEWQSWVFWYIVAAVVGFAIVLRFLHIFLARLRMRQLESKAVHPTRPNNRLSQMLATCTAVLREMSYPQIVTFSKKSLDWLTPPSLGRIIVIVLYWITITIMITNNAVVHDAYYWERIGFRGAWVSVAQVPLVILLTGKANIFIILSGYSHESLSWLHRWVARTLLISVTIHGGFFLSEWVRADFVSLELQMMPMVKYGMGLWFVLVWMNITGLAPIRRMAYGFYVLQHLASAAVFLWLLHKHVPSYAMYYVWMSIGFLAWERIAYGIWTFYRNVINCPPQTLTSDQDSSRKDSPFSPRKFNFNLGYKAEIVASRGKITTMTLKNVPFKWKAGQHIYIWVPRLAGIESHPFTILNTAESSPEAVSRNVQLAIRAHSGFSKRLYKKAQESTADSPVTMRAFLSGPFGTPPPWQTYETVILVAASTGASFTLPALESILRTPGCVTRVHFLLLKKNKQHSDCYLKQLEVLANLAQAHPSLTIRLDVVFSEKTRGVPHDFSFLSGDACSCATTSAHPSTVQKPSAPHTSRETTSPAPSEKAVYYDTSISKSAGHCKAKVHVSFERKDLENYILGPIEKAYGETLVAVCGGRRLTGDVRNIVAKLSDERAVHKGTGAQGICLFAEEYAF